MKKLVNYSMLAVAAMAAFACTKEIESDSVSEKSFEPLVINALADDDIAPDTKTSLSSVNVLWSDTDVVAGYEGSTKHSSNATAVTDGGKMAAFTFSTVSVNSDLDYLIYPATAAGEKESTAFNINLPSEQAATANSFANGANLSIAAGKVADDAVCFKNIGALIGFSINNDNVASVEVSANEAMTGHALVTPGEPVEPTVSKDGLPYVEMTGGITNGSQYYAVVYPGTYTGLTIKVTDTDGKLATYTNPNALTLNRNDNKQIADLTVAGGKWKTVKRTNWSHTITEKTWSANGAQTINGQSWTLAGDGGYWGYEAARGQQLGSGSNPYKSLTLTSDFGTDEGINEIIVSAATGGTASLSVSVGGHVFECSGSSSVALTSSNASYSFVSPDSKLRTGNVVVTIKQPSTSKANYIKAIEVNPIPAVATPEITITSGTATITCDTDGASIYYTLDGTDPTTSSTLYTTGVAVSSGATIKAIAAKDGYRNSAIASATNGKKAVYTFNTDAGIAALGITKPSSSSGTSLSTSTPYVVNGVSMTVTHGSTDTRVWNSSGTLDLRVYKSGGSLTFSVDSGSISSITIAGSKPNNFTYGGAAGTGSFTTGTWTAGATPVSTVTLSASNTGQINTITVIATN